MDPRYDAARSTCHSQRGWDFRPEPDAPARAAVWIAFGAVLLVGLAFICAIR